MTIARAFQLDRIGFNVRDLSAATAFYTRALGFVATPAYDAHPALAKLFGIRALRLVRLNRGRQVLELSACDPPGASYPANRHSNDIWFQHCALATNDIAAAYEQLQQVCFTPISRNGPELLPGGIVAFKFRDPDGHPLELIQFPKPDHRTSGGIDHSAISVTDPGRSIDFYTSRLGFAVQARQVNTGPSQDALDDLDCVTVDVVSLAPQISAPHLEFLGYRTPPGMGASQTRPNDIAASRLVFTTEALDGLKGTVRLSGGGQVLMIRDPDGHRLLLEEPASTATQTTDRRGRDDLAAAWLASCRPQEHQPMAWIKGWAKRENPCLPNAGAVKYELAAAECKRDLSRCCARQRTLH
jgi:catechol 2,3-dioxygenase-like lactoylglutathione lyase family enzyme